MKRFFLLLACWLAYSGSHAQPPVLALALDAITVLPANDALLATGLRPTPHQDLNRDPKVFAIQGWTKPDQTFTWQVEVREKGAYRVAILVEVKGLGANSPVTLQLSAAGRKISLQSHNRPWDKLFFPEALQLDKGINQLQLQLAGMGEGDQPDLSVYSLELATAATWKQKAAAAEKLRSKPEWLSQADYGLFFHWNARSKPRTGPAKSYGEAVQDFDVNRFAAMVAQTGAGFIVLTTSWDLSTFPAPLKSVDRILPGNTTPRDLIADLAAALSRRDIKLVVYCNFRINRMGWERGDQFLPGKADSVFNRLISIYAEIGQRYANKIGGLWIDDGMALYPYHAPFETLAHVIKQHDKQLVVGYNSWIYPRFTDFQDFYGGEQGITLEAAGINNKHLPVGGSGYFVSGPQQGLKATFCGLLEPGDWTHTELNEAIPPPLLKPDALISIIQEAMRRKNTAIMNVQVYQDGSISPETFALLKQLDQAVHNK